jgi:hypothetical protein
VEAARAALEAPKDLDHLHLGTLVLMPTPLLQIASQVFRLLLLLQSSAISWTWNL